MDHPVRPTGPSVGSDGPATLGQYASAIRRWWFVLALAIVAGAVTALVLLQLLPETYAATSSVIVESSPADSIETASGSEVNMDTEALVVRSVDVLERAASELDADDPLALLEAISVTVPPSTTVLRIRFEDADPLQTAAGANAVAAAYLEARRSRGESVLSEQSDVLQAEADRISSQLSPDNTNVEQVLLRDQFLSLQRNISEVRTTPNNPGRFLDRAKAPESPISPARPVVVGSVMALFAVVGVLLALLVDSRHVRVRSPREAWMATDLRPPGHVEDGSRRTLDDAALDAAIQLTNKWGEGRFAVVAVVAVGAADASAAAQALVEALRRRSAPPAREARVREAKHVRDQADLPVVATAPSADSTNTIPPARVTETGTAVLAIQTLEGAGFDDARASDAVVLAVRLRRDTIKATRECARRLVDAEANLFTLITWDSE